MKYSKIEVVIKISLHIIFYEIPQIIKCDLSIGNEWSKWKKYEKIRNNVNEQNPTRK